MEKEAVMAHGRVETAEEILDVEYPVLDKGFVRLVDYLGGDERIVQAARVSYGAGTKSFRQDRGLIRYLLRNGHTSPFEQVVFTFHLKMPIFVARQWIRHRTGRVNEISGRYSLMEEDFYLPAAEDIAYQSEDNKQGRSTAEVPETLRQEVRAILEGEYSHSYRVYRQLLDLGVAREVARIALPLSLYTQWYWQMDLHNLLHFLRLRMDPHAQLEIRRYAEQIFEIVREVCPLACEAFEDFALHSARFSRQELQALQAMLDGGECPLRGGERERFLKKLGRSPAE
jgi:thymidylate synthase (FAD)